MIRLNNSDWERIRHHFPEENISEGRPGRKPIPSRKILEATLWILNTGAQWHMLSQCYPNYKTVHRRFQTWCQSEILRRVLTDIANELRARGVLDEEESLLGVVQRLIRDHPALDATRAEGNQRDYARARRTNYDAAGNTRGIAWGHREGAVMD